MTYTQVRDTHFGQLPLSARQRVERSPQEAGRVHAALIRKAAAWGAARVVRDRAGFAAAVRRDLGIGSWLAPLLQAALVQMLLPILIQWLESQLATKSADPGTASLDSQLQRLAREAAR